MTLPLKKRRRMLEQTLIPQVQPYRVELSTMRLLKTAKELSDAFTESVQQNLEGLMIKDPNAGYKPADRKHWYKMKKDYLPENVREKAGLTMVDSVDLVVLGAAFGNGKNASLLSSYLMGCYDEEEREWQLVCKVCLWPLRRLARPPLRHASSFADLLHSLSSLTPSGLQRPHG